MGTEDMVDDDMADDDMVDDDMVDDKLDDVFFSAMDFDDDVWRTKLESLVDILFLQLEDLDAAGEKRDKGLSNRDKGTLSERGIEALALTLRRVIESVNYDEKDPLPRFSRALDLLELVTAPTRFQTRRLFVPRRRLLLRTLSGWRRVSAPLLRRLTERNLVDAETYLTAASGRGETLRRFGESLREMVRGGGGGGGDDLLRGIVGTAFEEGSRSSSAAVSVLDAMLCQDLVEWRDRERDDEARMERETARPPKRRRREALRVFHALIDVVDFEEKGKRKKLLFHLLTSVLTFDASVTCTMAIASQHEWTLKTASSNLEEMGLLFARMIPLSDPSTILHRAVDSVCNDETEISHRLFLFLVSCLLAADEGVGKTAASIVDSKIRDTFAEESSCRFEDLMIAFLLARHASFSASPDFPSYSEWFFSRFGHLPNSFVDSKRSFGLLVKFLSQLVQFEPAACLKTHLLHPPATNSPGCKECWQDYSALAKTRLADLKESLDQGAIFGSSDAVSKTGVESATKSDAANRDVDAAVAAFDKLGAVPQSVMAATMFKKSYFHDHFLPALLRPRPTPSSPDAVARFVDALVKANKIPAPIYEGYAEACRRESERWNSSESPKNYEEEVGEFFSSLSPMQRIRRRFDKLASILIAEATPTSASSRVSSSSSSSVLFDLDADVTSILRRHAHGDAIPAARLFRLVDAVIEGFCTTTLMTRDAGNQRQASWMTAFFSSIARWTPIHVPMVVRSIELCTTQLRELDFHQVFSLGRFLAHFREIETDVARNLPDSLSLGPTLPPKASTQPIVDFILNSSPPLDSNAETFFNFFLFASSFLDQLFNSGAARPVWLTSPMIPDSFASKMIWLKRRLSLCYFEGRPTGRTRICAQMRDAVDFVDRVFGLNVDRFIDHLSIQDFLKFEMDFCSPDDFLRDDEVARHFLRVVSSSSSSSSSLKLQTLDLLIADYLSRPNATSIRRRKMAAILNAAARLPATALVKLGGVPWVLETYLARRGPPDSLPPQDLVRTFLQLCLSLPPTSLVCDDAGFQESPFFADPSLIRALKILLVDIGDDSSMRCSFQLEEDISSFLSSSLLLLSNIDDLSLDSLSLLFPFLSHGIETAPPAIRRIFPVARRHSKILSEFHAALTMIDGAYKSGVVENGAIRSKVKALALLSRLTSDDDRRRSSIESTFVDSIHETLDALDLHVDAASILVHGILAEFNSFVDLCDDEGAALPHLEDLTRVLGATLAIKSPAEFGDLFTRKGLNAAAAVFPKSLVKRSPVAFILICGRIFATEAEDVKRNLEAEESKRNSKAEDLKQKLFLGKILNLVTAASKLLRLGGMVDSTVATATRRLFDDLVETAPERLKIETRDLLRREIEMLNSG